MAVDSKQGYVHEMRWRYFNKDLNNIGFWVQWRRDFVADQHQYAIGLKGERQPMGIYNDEETAQAMVKMLLSNAKHEED